MSTTTSHAQSVMTRQEQEEAEEEDVLLAVTVSATSSTCGEDGGVDGDAEEDEDATMLETRTSVFEQEEALLEVSTSGFPLKQPRLTAQNFIDVSVSAIVPCDFSSGQNEQMNLLSCPDADGPGSLGFNISDLFGTSSQAEISHDGSVSKSDSDPPSQKQEQEQKQKQKLKLKQKQKQQAPWNSSRSMNEPISLFDVATAENDDEDEDDEDDEKSTAAAKDSSMIVRRALSYDDQKAILGSAASASGLATNQQECYGMPDVKVEMDEKTRDHVRQNRMPLPGAPFSCALCGVDKHEAHLDTGCDCPTSKKLCTDCAIECFVKAMAPETNRFQLPTMVVEIDMEGEKEFHVLVHYDCTECLFRFDMVYRQYPLPIPLTRTNHNTNRSSECSSDLDDVMSNGPERESTQPFMRPKTAIPQSWIWRILHRKKVRAEHSKFIPRKGAKMVTESFDCWYRRKIESCKVLLEWNSMPKSERDQCRIYFCGDGPCRHANIVRAPIPGAPFPAVRKCESCNHLFCHCQAHLGPDTSSSEFVLHSQHVPLRVDLLGPFGEWAAYSEMTPIQRQWLGDLLDARVHDYAQASCPQCGVGRAQLTVGDSHVECPQCHRDFCFFCGGAFAKSYEDYCELRSKLSLNCFAFSFGHVAKIFNCPRSYKREAHNRPTSTKTESQVEGLNSFLRTNPTVTAPCVRHLKDIPYYQTQDSLMNNPKAMLEHYRRLRVALKMLILKEQWGIEKFVSSYFVSRQMQHLGWLNFIVTDEERTKYESCRAQLMAIASAPVTDRDRKSLLKQEAKLEARAKAKAAYIVKKELLKKDKAVEKARRKEQRAALKNHKQLELRKQPSILDVFRSESGSGNGPTQTPEKEMEENDEEVVVVVVAKKKRTSTKKSESKKTKVPPPEESEDVDVDVDVDMDMDKGKGIVIVEERKAIGKTPTKKRRKKNSEREAANSALLAELMDELN